MKLFGFFLFVLLLSETVAQGPYAPNASTSGTTAMYKDSSAFVSWASGCVINRGWQDIADTSLGKADVGTATDATGKAGTNGVVSLGDQGEAILSFDYPVFDGVGYDFAVFENSFSDEFLELAFVEVSSDGVNFFRFPTVSLTQDTVQIGTYGTLDATNLYNFAGKYRGMYGVPFDLNELAGTTGLDINNITHIKIIDVVGSIDTLYASYDSLGNVINDPYPTNFGSGGFDLDAVGVIHQFVGIEEIERQVNLYPNPASDKVIIEIAESSDLQLNLMDMHGRVVKKASCFSQRIELDISDLDKGIYFLQVAKDKTLMSKKLIVE